MATTTQIRPTSTDKPSPQPHKTPQRPLQEWAAIRLFGNGRHARDFHAGVEVRHSGH